MAERNKADRGINSWCTLTPKYISYGNSAVLLIDLKKATEQGDFKGSHAWLGRAVYLGLKKAGVMFFSESIGVEVKK